MRKKNRSPTQIPPAVPGDRQSHALHNPTERSPHELVVATATFLGSITGLTAVIGYMPKSLAFGTITIWAVLCALCSGGVWSGLVGITAWLSRHRFDQPSGGVGLWGFRLNEKLSLAGGINQEPRYVFDSTLWSLIVFGPLTMAAYLIQRKASQIPHPTVYWAFLVGATIGAVSFYARGTRDKVVARRLSDKTREAYLVWRWTATLAIPALVFYELAYLLFLGFQWSSIERLLTRTIVVLLLPVVITIYVLIVPDDPQKEAIRGVIAGGFLVLVFLAALLLLEPADLQGWLDELTGLSKVFR